MKIVSQDEICQRIKNKFPNQPFEIVEYTKVSKPFSIRCLKCGKTTQYSSFNNYINSSRKALCFCYNSNNKQTKHLSNLEKIKNYISNSSDMELVDFWYRQETKKYMVRVKCLKCQQVYSKPWGEFLKNPHCPFCVGRELLNTQAVKALLPTEYELLSEYSSTNEKVLVKHKCGFIWKTKVKKLYDNFGCPHCNKKRSKGEQKITNWLMNNEKAFEIEHSFDWQSNKKRRYDFYLPDYNLIIEYNGEQHYLENKYFKTSLEEQQKIDTEKEKEAVTHGYNYLIIGYFDFDKIDTILNNWFNDYLARE